VNLGNILQSRTRNCVSTKENWNERCFHEETHLSSQHIFMDASSFLWFASLLQLDAARGIEAGGNQERDTTQSFFFYSHTPEGGPSPRAL
jgi:hypothetical protein